MEPQHLRMSVKQQNRSVLLTTISSSLLPCVGWGRIPNPHLNSMSCHAEVRPDLQHRSELCAQVFQKESSTPNMWDSPGSRNCVSRTSSKSGITHMTWALSQHLLSPWVSLHRQSGSTLYNDFALVSSSVLLKTLCTKPHYPWGHSSLLWMWKRKMTKNNNCPPWQPSKGLKFSDNMIVINALQILINVEMHALFLLPFSKSSHHF